MSWIFIACSFVLGGVGAWFMSHYAYSFGLLDIPNDRSSHNLPTPRGGGIGVLVAYIISSVWLKLSLMIWLPAVLLSVVSFFDDKLGLTPRTRLIFQFTAAMVVAGASFPTSHSSFFMILPLVLFSIIIVGTANFYNFMDGINGIAGITGAVAFGLLGSFALFLIGQNNIAFSSYAVAAACIGFLPFNVPKARVFMGDVGSILLGFVFAGYVVVLAQTAADFLVMAGFLSTFYADALTTLYIRKRDGERLSQAHRRHLYQLFANQKQVPHWKVSVCYGIIQLLIGLSLLVFYTYGWKAVLGFECVLLAVWCLVMRRVRRTVEGGVGASRTEINQL